MFNYDENDIRTNKTKGEYKTSIVLKRKTKEKLKKYIETHYGDRKITYDKVINYLLMPDDFKNFETWNLKGLNSDIIKYIKNGKNTNRKIQQYMKYKGYEVSLRTIQKHCIALEKEKIIINTNPNGRIKKWKITEDKRINLWKVK